MLSASDDEADSAEEMAEFREEEDNRIRFSRLKLIAKSPAHYRYSSQRDTAAKDKGTAVHAFLKDQRVTFYPEKTKTGRSAPRNGAKWEQFEHDNADAMILKASDYDDVQGMVESIHKHRRAMEVLTGVREETLSFDLLKLACRTTADVRGDGFFTELKSSVSADPKRFRSQSFWMSYHAQMALHRLGIKRAVKGSRPDAGFVVVVESSKPYPVTVFRMTEKAIQAGEKQIRLWMETLKGCLASDQWPPYAQSDVELDVLENEEYELPGNAEPYTAENLPEGW